MFSLLTLVVTFAEPNARNASCEVYTQKTDNCATSACRSCFNSGGRSGAICNGEGGQTGYYCPAEVNAASGDITFACMDWTFGSNAIKAAESSFNVRTGDDVYFGVGTFGTAEDPQNGLAACYRLTTKGMDKDIIAQSINTGHDVAGNQFDLQIGAGGAGAYNNCAGNQKSMFPGDVDVWGCVYGGVDSREACASLPMYPQDDAAMRVAGDSLVGLCEYGWDKNARLSGAGMPAGECKYNPTLLDVSRVKCPEELVQMTWAQRSDDPASYLAETKHRLLGFPNADKECQAQIPGSGAAYCMTRMMDCRKPSGAFKDNVRADLMVDGRRVVQTCLSDGYTRIDVQCGCADCYC